MKKLMKIVCAAALALALVGCSKETKTASKLDPTSPVEITGGKITGAYNDDETVAVYKGIPYAKAPVGELRWKAPETVESWEDVKECTSYGPSAIQQTQAPFMMWSEEFIIEDTGYSEDCLNLNIYAPADDIKDKPVIVYIHGGGFTSGGNSCEVYDGVEMAKKGIVFVNINYRVGVLGFLAHPKLTKEQGTSGNYGLMDQIFALKWVQNNIETFGGDASNVTIMGQSAGAAGVNDLIISPEAKGLFTKAVSESFSALFSTLKDLSAAEVAGEASFDGKTLEEMRAMSTEELLAVQGSWSPIIDGKVLVDQYTATTKAAKENNISLMTGFVTGDTGLFAQKPVDENGNITKASLEAHIQSKYGEFADLCLAAYEITDENAAEVFDEMAIDDMTAQYNIVAKLRGDRPTYRYYFTHVMPGVDADKFGAFHTADVPYFLNVFSDLRKDYWQDEDYKLGDTMSSYLANFAKTGNPNGEGLPTWDAYSDGSYLVLDSEIKTDKLNEAKTAFYDAYYESIVK